MEDIDLENCQIHITKTYYHMNRTDIITEPKTDNSVRTIEIPIFLVNEIKYYWNRLYQYPKNERLFPVVAEAVQHSMNRHIDKAGVKCYNEGEKVDFYVLSSQQEYSRIDSDNFRISSLSFEDFLIS